MKILQNVILAPYTTFKIGGPAKYFCVVKDQFDALNAYEFAREKNLDVFVLGGGSNVLISDEGFDGLVAKVENKGIEMVYEDDQSITLKIASGENWDEAVKFVVKNQWWGIENLSHIPGSAGAIAVQNVGAYGQEASNIIKSVAVFDKQTHQILDLNNSQCGFSYRKSIFNSTHKGKYIIFYITLKLSKVPNPILTYRDLENHPALQATLLVKQGIDALMAIRQAVIEIRDKKYPFPTEAKRGNAGSFFKNPSLDKATYNKLEDVILKNFGVDALEVLQKKIFKPSPLPSPNGRGERAPKKSEIFWEPEGEGVIKIPAAYLMELCGLKDLQQGGAKINRNQPLVIINEIGNATAKDVLKLACLVKKVLFETLGVIIEFEPELVGFSKDYLNDIINLGKI